MRRCSEGAMAAVMRAEARAMTAWAEIPVVGLPGLFVSKIYTLEYRVIESC